MNTLPTLRYRLRVLLGASAAGTWRDDLLDEALRLALLEYSQACPRLRHTTLTVGDDAPEIALDALENLLQVSGVHWPYHPHSSRQPANRVNGWRLTWDDGRARLWLRTQADAAPQPGDSLHVWYAAGHCLDGLDGATSTSLPPGQSTLLLQGALGLVICWHALDPLEWSGRGEAAARLHAWGKERLSEFRQNLWNRRATPGAPQIEAVWPLDR